MSHPVHTDVRTVTVLAGDFAAGAHPEQGVAAAATPGIFARVREVLEAAGGRVERGPGNEFTAVFGAPLAGGEESVRAVRAAMALQKEVAGLSALARAALAFRVGIHSGVVPWPTPGDEQPEAFRETLVEARRLLHSAPPGDILVSPAIARAASARFRFKQVSPESFQAVGEVETRRDSREDRPTSTVGREAELEQLLEAFDRAEGDFLLVEGDAGVGKSRLLYEFQNRLMARGTPVLVAFGRAHEGPPVPLSALGDLVRQAAGVTGLAPGDGGKLSTWISGHLEEAIPDPIDRENCAHLIVMSLGLLIPGTRVAQIEPARIRSETHYAWLRWLRALAARHPVVLCLEDLHLADDSTISLLESLAAGLAGERVTFVGARRPAAKTPRGCLRIRLEELSRDATVKLAEELFHGPVSPELADFLFEQSGGHPYYHEELSRYLVEAGLVSGDPLHLVSRPRKLPDGLHGLLVARIDSMGHDDREILMAASVFGRFFWSGLLEQALFRKVDRGLERARRRQIVAPRTHSLIPGDSEYTFRHDLLRDAAYSLLTAREKSRLHRVVADLLEPHIGTGGRRLRALVATHREASGKREEPARLWQEAAEEALRDSAFAEALSHARDAHRLGRGPAARLVAARALVRLARLDEALVEATAVAGSPDASAEEASSAKLLEGEIHGRRGDREAFLAIVEKVAAAGPPGFVLPEALVQKSRVLWGMNRHDEALKCVAEIRSRLAALAPPEGDRRAEKLLADSYAIEGQVLWKQGKKPEAAAAYQRALAIAARIGDRLATASTLNSIGALHRDLRADQEARTAFEQSLAILREIGDRIGVAAALTNLGLTCRESGDLQAAADAQRESLEIYRQTGDQHAVVRSLKFLSDALLDGGNITPALEPLDESLRLSRLIGDRTAEMLALRNLGQAHAALGNEKLALEELSLALSLTRSEKNAFNEALIHLRLGEIHASAGGVAEAAGSLDSAIRIAGERSFDEILAAAFVARARLRVSSHAAGAGEDAGQALGLAVKTRNAGHEAAALSAQARLEALSGNGVEARELLGQALALAPRCFVFHERLRLIVDEAETLNALGDTGAALEAVKRGERMAGEKGALGAVRSFRGMIEAFGRRG
ncbi:MAG: tetratricopeptide repeat protein [Planctomycetes bacterium]|nr:tetratricopeptide repeat protein [Planctomycetota bacterium]